VGELARELGCDRGASTSGAGSWRWLNQDKKRHGPARTHLLIARKSIALKQLLADKDPGGGFFQGALQKIEARPPAQQRLWRNGIYDQIREVMSLQGSLSIERMCQMVLVSRRGFYRSLKEQQPVEEEMESAICDPTNCLGASPPLRLSTSYGGAAPPGMQVNHKRVARIMREDNLLGCSRSGSWSPPIRITSWRYIST